MPSLLRGVSGRYSSSLGAPVEDVERILEEQWRSAWRHTRHLAPHPHVYEVPVENHLAGCRRTTTAAAAATLHSSDTSSFSDVSSSSSSCLRRSPGSCYNLDVRPMQQQKVGRLFFASAEIFKVVRA